MDVAGQGAAAVVHRCNTDPRAARTRQKLVAAFHEAVRDCDPAACLSVPGPIRQAKAAMNPTKVHRDERSRPT